MSRRRGCGVDGRIRRVCAAVDSGRVVPMRRAHGRLVVKVKVNWSTDEQIIWGCYPLIVQADGESLRSLQRDLVLKVWDEELCGCSIPSCDALAPYLHLPAPLIVDRAQLEAVCCCQGSKKKLPLAHPPCSVCTRMRFYPPRFTLLRCHLVFPSSPRSVPSCRRPSLLRCTPPLPTALPWCA